MELYTGLDLHSRNTYKGLLPHWILTPAKK